METKTPTIKGLFVKSHISALKEAKGDEGLKALARMYGKSLKFGSFQNVPVADEVEILDCIIYILHGEMPGPKQAFEAGRLHFRNFIRTSPAKLVFAQSKLSLKRTLLWADKIASRIFDQVKFSTEDVGKQTVKITLENSDYPLEHFQGFFEEWISSLGYVGGVTAEQIKPGTYEYVIDWHEDKK